MGAAVVYCRVSTKEQTKNLSLPVQQAACEEFCARQGWRGGAGVRRGGRERQDRRPHRVPTHARLLPRAAKGRRGRRGLQPQPASPAIRPTTTRSAPCSLATASPCARSPSRSSETPAGRLIEGIFAGYHEFDNGLKRERTLAGMREALERGRWVWRAPLGYLNRRSDDGREKWIEPDPERASFIRRAFAEMATGHHTGARGSRADQPGSACERAGGTRSPRQHWSAVCCAIRSTRAASTCPQWGIDLPGPHEPLVSEADFRRVQLVLAGKKVVPEQLQAGPPGLPAPALLPLRWLRTGRSPAAARTGHTGKRYRYYHCRSSIVPRDQRPRRGARSRASPPGWSGFSPTPTTSPSSAGP